MKTHLAAWRWLVLFVALLTPTFSFGQQEGFPIGDVYLYLGMPENIVLEKLKHFTVAPVPGSNTYIIGIKTKDHIGDLYEGLGSVTFSNKKLSYMSRRWYYSANDKQTLELANKLFHLLQQEVGDKGEIGAKIKANSTRDPEKETKFIEIVVGNRKISFVIVESNTEAWGRQISIFEAISKKPF